MSDTPQLLLAHHLKALKLPTFLREYDKLAQQCAAEGVDHPRYLLRLAELELIERERRMVERRIREARFPTVKSLEAEVSGDREGQEMKSKGKGEGSAADIRQDRAGARRAGKTLKAYEGSAADRRADKARMGKKRK